MEDDVSGVWSGWYDYGAGRGRTDFSAMLMSGQGSLSGMTLEVHASGYELSAGVTGCVQTGYVTFTKVYLNARSGFELPVAYSGEVNADGSHIEGQWVIEAGDDLFGVPLRYVGSFQMSRVSLFGSARAQKGADIPEARGGDGVRGSDLDDDIPF